MSTSGLSFVLYRSEAVGGDPLRHLPAILDEARVFNAINGITGALYAEAGMFFQWFEGSAAACEVLRVKLLRDPRHCNMTVLAFGPLAERLFGSWAMARVERGGPSLFDHIVQNGRPGADGTAGAIRDFLIGRMRGGAKG